MLPIDKMKNIAIFCNSLNGSGAKRVLIEFMQELSRRGHVINFYSFSSYREILFQNTINIKKEIVYPIKKFNRVNIKIFLLEQVVNLIRTFLYLRIYKKSSRILAHKINRGGYDVAFINGCEIMRVPYILRYLNVPSVYFCHNPNRKAYEPINSFIGKTDNKKQKSIKKIYKILCHKLVRLEAQILDREARRNIGKATIVLTNSFYTKAYISKVYGVSAKVNYPGIDIQKFKPMNLKRKGFILSVGGIDPIKGFDFIVNSLSLIPIDQRPSLTLVGNRVINRAYLDLMESAKQKQVGLTILNSITDNELIHLYNEALLVVYVPRSEPLGLVPLEAMACGTPVIGVNEGGLKESIKNNETGILIDRDMHELSQYIRKLLTSKDIWKKMSSNGPFYIGKYWTWKKSTDQLEESLEEAIRR